LGFISKNGGDGGAGGAAGRIRIDPAAALRPHVTHGCSRSSPVYGHNVDNPFNGSATATIGQRVTLCSFETTEDGGTNAFDALSLVLATQNDGKVCPGSCDNARALGGSGGIPGGSFKNFDVGPDGATGSFGSRGLLGQLEMPQELKDAIPVP
jgi:hypothetical protein